MKYLALLALAALGIGAGTALATDYHPPLHPTTGDECTVLHPCEPVHPSTDTTPVHPPVTVTVTTPAPPTQTVTVDRPAPPAQVITTPAPPAVTITTPPTVRVVTKVVYKIKYKTRWRTRTVVQRIIRTKIIRDRCPPPPVCCEGKG